ncbi:MAG: metallophosphoesterase [Lachnospiraceae bacterium]|nr:metallophosphoesterase [Lachnospiraceae bacterium]
MLYVVVLFMVLLLFFLMVAAVDTNRFKISRYTLESRKIVSPYSFVVLADLHNKQYGAHNWKLLQAIDRLHPEGIFLAGDMLTSIKGRDFTPALELIHRLAEKYPIFYGAGNHETRLFLYPEVYGKMGEEYERSLLEKQVRILHNEGCGLPEYNIHVTGLELTREYYRRMQKVRMASSYLEETLGKPDKEVFQILLAHNPEYFKEYAKWGADLVLSGHLHGGIMRLPLLGGVISPSLKLFPGYDSGMYHQGDSAMVLSRGLGVHTIPLRIFNPGELILIELLPAKKKDGI